MPSEAACLARPWEAFGIPCRPSSLSICRWARRALRLVHQAAVTQLSPSLRSFLVHSTCFRATFPVEGLFWHRSKLHSLIIFNMTVVRQQSHGIVKSAGERFAGTYELLEETLLHLPLRRLLLAQNVCKAFQQVVNNSMKIKRALFLEPATDETLTWQDRKGCAGGVWISSKTGENVPSLMLNPFMPL